MTLRLGVAAFVAFLMLGCGGGSHGSAAPAASAASTSAAPSCEYYDYRFELDADLSTLTATVCFDGPPPPALVCGPQGDMAYTPTAARISGESVTPLPTAPCRIVLDALVAGDCVRYAVELRNLDQGFPLRIGATDARVVTAQTGAFVFRPERRTAGLHGHATLALPDGVDVSLPWLRDADGYLLDASVFAQSGYAVFGVFERERVHALGASVEAVLVDSVEPTTRAAIAPWLRRVVETASQLGGAFPTERAQLVLMPQPGAGGVRFGMVARGGGPSLVFVFGRASTETELIESWEPGHELTHLRTPFVTRDDRWLSEGIATYYQEVLRARAAIATPQHAWRRLMTGLARGQQVGTGRTLRRESAEMYSTGAFQRVYWAGAAIALLADVELRRRSNNTTSLDTVVLALQACCAQNARAWTASEMITRMDTLSGHTVFQELSTRYLDQTEFPDVQTVFSLLGVSRSESSTAGEVTLDSTVALSTVRDAIMAPHPGLTASPHPGLTASP